MKKIGILGIGGVGGYFGGLLAKKFENSDEAQVFFIARGEHEETIRQNGLRVEATTGNFTVRPTLVTSEAGKIGPVDLLIICTKSYSLEQSLNQYRACIGPDTILLPLLNGVDSKERIQQMLPQNEVWDGCVYVVSRYIEPGLVRETGGIGKLFFGSEDGSPERLNEAEKLLQEAGFKATLSGNILSTIWEKFLFISSVSTTLTYLDEPVGAVLENPEHKQLVVSLLQELIAVAQAQEITLPSDVTQRTLDTMARLPYDTITSMYSDYLNGNRTETQSLTGYVVRLGHKLQVPVPTYEKLFNAIKEKVQE